MEDEDLGFADFGAPAEGSGRLYKAPGAASDPETESAAEGTPRRRFGNLEHETGLEPATPTLATWRSTN